MPKITRDRLNVEPTKELSELIFRPAIERDFRLGFRHMIQINEAHIMMLFSTGIIPRTVAGKLLIELEYLKEQKLSETDLDPSLEDLHFNIEDWLIKKTGSDIGGRMHTARSRNDLHATLDRMIARDMAIELIDLLCQLRYHLLELAAKHLSTVMTGYTHMQPAQPITLGHYFCALALVLERDSKRLEAAYESINQCPLGACALAGTGFPIDRKMTAEFLGFEGIVENSLDAVASRDWIPELLAALSIMMTNISRLSTDLYIWFTDEFSYIDIEGDIAAVSSIMPQKKNPIIFEHCKSKAAHVFGALMSSLACLKNTPFTHSRDVAGESIELMWKGIEEARTTLKLIQVALSFTTVRKEVMLERATLNFSTATELADTLVRNYNLSFRVAHAIVARLVAKSIAESLRADKITPEMVDEIAMEIIGRKVNIDASTLKSVLSPELNVNVRNSLGGPAESEVKRMVSDARTRLEKCHNQIECNRDAISQALKNLSDQVQGTINNM